MKMYSLNENEEKCFGGDGSGVDGGGNTTVVRNLTLGRNQLWQAISLAKQHDTYTRPFSLRCVYCVS